jgi:predicted alpha/beta hydrolase family esterase
VSDRARLLVVHRWGARPEDVWYPWLRRELSKVRPPPFDEIRVPAFPTPDAPAIDAWIATIGRALGQPTPALERTVLVGHSVGCQAILRWLATLPRGARVRGVVLVAAWWSVDAPWPEIEPWIDTPFDETRARECARRVEVLLGTADPFVADQEASAALFRERLDARVTIVPNAGHFNAEKAPAVLTAVAGMG